VISVQLSSAAASRPVQHSSVNHSVSGLVPSRSAAAAVTLLALKLKRHAIPSAFIQVHLQAANLHISI
jgi:hypothetical protein